MAYIIAGLGRQRKYREKSEEKTGVLLPKLHKYANNCIQRVSIVPRLVVDREGQRNL
jgi:hypothetical protein